MYIINVSERYGRNWNDTEDAYKFFFRSKEDCPFRAREVAKKLNELFPAPEYNVTFYVERTYIEKKTLDEFGAK